MKIHFIGIGGAGCMNLAALRRLSGDEVSGSDNENSQKLEELKKLGIQVFVGHSKENLPDHLDYLVYSSAVGSDNPELVAARARNVPCMRRGEFLALTAKAYRRPVAVSGAHGKSSISALLSFVLADQGIDISCVIGAKVAGKIPSYRHGDGDILVVESDESDGTNVFLTPYLGIIPNVDDDHAWSVGGEAQLLDNYRKFASNCRKLVYFEGELPDKIFAGHPDAHRVCRRDFSNFGLPEAGFFGINSRLVLKAALLLGADAAKTVKAISKFPGVERRMSCRFRSEKLLVIEDYAHHPAELASSLEILRSSDYSNYHLRVVFQVHRYARLVKYFDDFARLLRQADSVILAPLFAAWCENGDEKTVQELAAAVGEKAVAFADKNWREMADEALDYSGEKPLLLAVVGAGDVEQLLNYLPK